MDITSSQHCDVCSRLNGLTINTIDGNAIINRMEDDSDNLRNHSCPEKHQCIGDGPVGRCYPCSLSQACPRSTIANISTFDIENLCPPGYSCSPFPMKCPSGTICYRNRLFNCVMVQKEARRMGYKHLFDGSYCDEGTFAMGNCPTGYYCPDAGTKIICPRGYFCPMKTLNPTIVCRFCAEGAVSLHRPSAPIFIVAIGIFCLVIAVCKKSPITSRNVTKTEIDMEKNQTGGNYHSFIPHKYNSMSLARKTLPPDIEDVYQQQQGMSIRYKNISLVINHSKNSQTQSKVICNASGLIKPREITAVLGESGCGKTSLINVLGGRASYGQVSGTILLNGRISNFSDLRRAIGFVPQDDILYDELTVMENLFFSGRFLMPLGTSNDEIEKHAKTVLKSLGLESIKNSIVGSVECRGISGGEKRRCSIGVELMAKHKQILFLDEPTSGLDTSSSKLVIETLKALTIERKMTVLCSLHQPRRRIFDLLDNIIVLEKGGKKVYDGTTKDVGAYFAKWFQNDEYENIADWLVDISTRTLLPFRLSEMCKECGICESDVELRPNIVTTLLPKLWEKNCTFTKQPLIEENSNFDKQHDHKHVNNLNPPFLKQLQYQIRRSLLLYKRAWLEKIIEFICISSGTCFISMIEGETILVDEFASHNITFYEMNMGDDENMISDGDVLSTRWMAISPILRSLEFAMKVAMISGVLTGLASTRSMSSKQVHLKREVESGYNLDAYFVATSVLSTIEYGLYMVFTGAIAFWIRHPISSLGSYLFNFFMLSFAMVSWGHLFSIVVPKENLIIISGIFLMVFNLLASGVTAPIQYHDLYRNRRLALISGLLSPARFFIETMIVSDLRCLPEQYGYTDNSFNKTSFDVIGLAIDDKANATINSCNGWHWGFPRLLSVSLTVRILSITLIKTKYNRRVGFLNDSGNRIDLLKVIELVLFGCFLVLSIFLLIK